MNDNMNIAVILPAAGKGERFASQSGKKTPKLELDLNGRSVLLRAIELFTARADVKQVIVAVDPDGIDTFKFKWGDKLGFLGVKVVAGGKKERWETVLNALEAVDDDVTHVAVHDAARPVASKAMIDRVFEAAGSNDAVIPAVPVSATIKRAEKNDAADEEADPLDAILGSAGKKAAVETYRVTETVPRAGLWLVQTPQVVEVGLMREAYQQIRDGELDGSGITDDAGLVEALGKEVTIVDGDSMNVKITIPDDLEFAKVVQKIRSGEASKEALGAKRRFETWAEMEDG